MVAPYRYVRVLCFAMLISAVVVPRSAAQYATQIAITGVPIPGSAGNAFSTFGPADINMQGQVAFQGLFPGGQGVFSMNGYLFNTLPSATDNLLPPMNQTPGATFPSAPLLHTIELSGQPPTPTMYAPATTETIFTAFPFTQFNAQVALNNWTQVSGSNPYQFGAVALQGQMVNANGPQGIFGTVFPSQQNPSELAFTNHAAVGFPAAQGITYTSLGTSPALDDNNAAAFVAGLSNGGQGLYITPIPSNTGLVNTNPAQPGLVAQAGTPTPTLVDNVVTLQTFTTDFPVSLVSDPTRNFPNILAFQATVNDPVKGTTLNALVFGSGGSGSGGISDIVPHLVGGTANRAETTYPSPVSLNGATFNYSSFLDPVSLSPQGAGQIAFRAMLNSPNPTNPTDPTTAAAIFAAQIGGGAPNLVATTLSPNAANFALPINYSTTFPQGATFIGFGGLAQSNDGQLVFPAALFPTSLPGGGAGGGGIFLAKTPLTSSVTRPIAVSGDTAPGTGGATYASFFNDTLAVFSPLYNSTSVAINDHVELNRPFTGGGNIHEIAFQAFLAGAGVNGSNNVGLFIANDQLLPGSTTATETALLARTGELLTVSPGVTKPIFSFVPFNTRTGNGANSFNDLGQLAVSVNFLDGGGGVYVFTPDLHLSPFVVKGVTPPTVSWGSPGSNQNGAWTFSYNPAQQVYRIVIDPADVGPTTTAVTVSGPTVNQSIPGLQIGSNQGTSHLTMQPGITLTLGGGAITSGINVLTIQGPSDITNISTGTPGTLKLLGDVTSNPASGLVSNVGSFTANIAANFDLGNVPFAPILPNNVQPPPSTADVDRFRSFTVARGNFVGAYPVDLLLTGNISSPSEMVTVGQTTVTNGSSTTTTITVTNDVHRGILKAGPGVLRLTGFNTFGPNTATPMQVNDPYAQSAFIQSIVVTGGLLSFDNDNPGTTNLGLLPATTVPAGPYRGRWITLDGGGLGLQTNSTSTLASPTILDPSRGIAVGPVTGFGTGTIDVFGTNVLSYAGVIADNTDGVTKGIGTLIKTGAGTLILGGLNTYSGGTIINGGTLQISQLPNIANGSVVDNGVLAFNLSTNTVTVSQVISGSGAVANVGPNTTLVLTGTNTYAGGTNLAAGTVSVTSDANLGSESGPLFFNGGTLRINGTSFTSTPRAIFWNGGGFLIGSNNTFTVSQSLSDPGVAAPLAVGSVTGGGVLVLSGNNTFTGGITLGQATLSVSSDSNLGAPTGSITIGGISTLRITGTTFNSTPRPIIWGNGGGGFDIVAAANTFTVAQSLLEPAPGTVASSLSKFGAGTLVLTGTNTYLGSTTIFGGTLSVSADANLGAASTQLVFESGILQVTGTNFTSTPRSINWGNGGQTGGGGFDIVAAANTFTVSQPLGAVGGGFTSALTKLGAGTLVLTGTNTYSGGTFLNGGRIRAFANTSLGALNGGGTIGDPLTFNGGLLQFGAVFDPTTSRPTTFLAPGGGGFDSNNLNVTIAGVLGGAGGLTKAGNGSVTLTPPLATGNTYAGGTTVNQGTLFATTDAGSGTGGAVPYSVAGNDLALGLAGTPVTVNALGTLTFTGPTTGTGNGQITIPTSRLYTLNGGTLSVAAPPVGSRTVVFNNTSIIGGYLAGPGTFATSNAANASTSFFNGATLASANVVLNGADTVFNYSQGGNLTVATVATTPATFVTLARVTNQGSGTINIGAAGSGPSVNVSDFQSYGQLIINPATTNGQIALLTNTGSSPLSFNGGSRTLIGAPTSTNFKAGIDLHGQNAVLVGGLFINNGFVVDSSAAGTATLIADYGSLVEGLGFFQNSPIFLNGAKFKAGLCPGQATFGNLVMGPGGLDNDIFYINNATGISGPSPDAAGHVSGWSNLKAIQQLVGSTMTTGDFTWTATPTEQMKVALDTLINPTVVGVNVAGPMDNFDPTQSYTWPAAEWAGTYHGPTDPAMLNADTAFDTSGFLNPVQGTFGWALSGSSLSLTYTPSPVPEPGTLALLGAAAAGFAWRRRRRAK